MIKLNVFLLSKLTKMFEYLSNLFNKKKNANKRKGRAFIKKDSEDERFVEVTTRKSQLLGSVITNKNKKIRLVIYEGIIKRSSTFGYRNVYLYKGIIL